MNVKTRDVSEREFFSYGVVQKQHLELLNAIGQTPDNTEFQAQLQQCDADIKIQEEKLAALIEKEYELQQAKQAIIQELKAIDFK